MIDIVCNIDKDYVEHCGVMLTSLFVNNRESDFRIHVINTGIGHEGKCRLMTGLARFKVDMFFYDVDFSCIKDFPITEKDHLSLAAYLRLFMSKLLPDNIDKVLYLDCDLLVVDSIKELWEVDIEDVAVAVVEERAPFDTESPKTLNYPIECSYFNSGVMLVNLKNWRERDLYAEAVRFISVNKSLIMLHDQDVLNALLCKEHKFISIRWNLMDFFLFIPPDVQKSRTLDWELSIRQPAIIHFTGKRKPWLRNCDSPYRNQYVRLTKQYEWRVITLRETIYYYLRKVWYKTLIFLHLRRKRILSLSNIQNMNS